MVATASALYAFGYQPPLSAGLVSRLDGGQNRLLRSFAYCVAGTMGFLSPQALERSYSTSITTVHYKAEGIETQAEEAVALARNPSQDLVLVREVFKPAVLELAKLFGVSRQAVYDWQAGTQPARQSTDRLAMLARAAAVFAEAQVEVDARALRRRVSGGGTVLDAVLNGGDAEKVAYSLVPTLQREATQRQRLSQQLAGRKRVPVSADAYGAPAASEDA